MELGDYSEQEYEEMFQVVKKYLKENPGANADQISKGAEIPLKVVTKFFEEGRLIEAKNNNKMSPEKRRELILALSKEYFKSKTQDTKSQNSNIKSNFNSNSQLTRDLDTKYNNSRDER